MWSLTSRGSFAKLIDRNCDKFWHECLVCCMFSDICSVNLVGIRISWLGILFFKVCIKLCGCCFEFNNGPMLFELMSPVHFMSFFTLFYCIK